MEEVGLKVGERWDYLVKVGEISRFDICHVNQFVIFSNKKLEHYDDTTITLEEIKARDQYWQERANGLSIEGLTHKFELHRLIVKESTAERATIVPKQGYKYAYVVVKIVIGDEYPHWDSVLIDQFIKYLDTQLKVNDKVNVLCLFEKFDFDQKDCVIDFSRDSTVEVELPYGSSNLQAFSKTFFEQYFAPTVYDLGETRFDEKSRTLFVDTSHSSYGKDAKDLDILKQGELQTKSIDFIFTRKELSLENE